MIAFERVISLIQPENVASARVAERLGAVPGRSVQLLGTVSIVWEHPRAAVSDASGV